MKKVVTDPQKVTRILQAATDAFGQLGFAKTKTDQIAATAGVSKGLIFHYFGNKQALYLDTFKTAYQRIYAHMDPHHWQDAPGLAAMMSAAVKYEMKLQLAFPAEYRLMMQAYADLPHFPQPLQQQIQQETQAISVEANRIFREKIEQLPRRQGISVDDIFSVVSALIAQQTAVTTQLIATGKYRNFEDLQAVVDQMNRQLKIVEHGFLPD
ncbi:TetR/AcrR family transcriptional regulator [Lacticaseibacillus casei]|jgi:AcrR family transcriptional regulator|uniref:TetR/AcrR family transcriptional regulator n=1 Tax=Lacticaseibacillus huelsenbergensis TaxID=3035291 RepID=A0ABY8DQS9_9LACO|nr:MULTISPECIES: TetR/AcrR family transcriptional regulator [Lacticaseibacillus]MDG3060782.1 TetR/AcrR family transcriptional regulator [Lacticaseibacillus sp. BCRC 81376]QVI37424.1 TetR/AcrR family transcriptional regulator [Lacticaseibacillus casei]QXG59215.1 TetR/AcrR family transcriptional regulator [Lacticaseibacillus casei]WFB39330.1 TetR/AcrR family transcriptional regulator [Lacticaseibacillus huelsenbergensis]WFB41032.1 TetR/AcrR family transcriptional regulator [Lacticaseibacillus hu